VLTFAPHSLLIASQDQSAAVVNGQLQRSRRMEERMAEDNWFFTKMYVRR
jgi:hypothetical protein